VEESNFTTSVIIPTLNRADDLKEMLVSLLKQTVLPNEIIIVDQSKDLTSKIMTELLLEGYGNISLIYIKDPSITGAAQARNIGINSSTGEIVFFFDDDVILENDFIEEILTVYKNYPSILGVGGVITNYEFLAKTKIKLFYKIFYHGIFLDERREIFTNFHEIKQPVFVSKLSGGCCSFKKIILDNQNFDENFDSLFGKSSFGEDIELCLRLIKKGKLLISPYARLAHYSDTTKTYRSTMRKFALLQIKSFTYIFIKNFKFNLIQWIFFIWFLIGWTLMLGKSYFKK